MKSIRRFLTVWLLVGVSVLAAATGVVLHRSMSNTLVEEFDRATAAKARVVASFVEQDGEWVEFSYTTGSMPEFEDEANPEYFDIKMADGRTVGQSLTAERRPLVAIPGVDRRGSHFDLDLPDGRPGRAARIESLVQFEPIDEDDDATSSPPVTTTARNRIVVIVARSREYLDQTLANIRRLFLIAGVTLALLTGAFVAATVGRGLSPLVRLEAGAATIDAERLDRRLPTSGQPREVASLSTKLNELLARLQGAFERERRMTANIAHELRTPVSELKVSCELADRWPEDPELAASLQETARAVSNRMERIVDGLMHLARVESGREALVNHRTDLQDLVQQAWSDLNSVTAARRVSLLSEGTAVIVATDRHLCGLVITGLVENAARHAIEGSTVLSEMASGRESVVWSLSNEAQGLVVADLDRLVEPFWCKDSARTDQDSTGLGLALAEAIVRRLGGRLEFSLEGHNFRVRLHLPATTRRHGEVENRADAAANRETLGRPVTLP